MAKRQAIQLNDELEGELLDAINTKFKKQSNRTAYYLDDPDVQSDITGWVSTECDPLDLLISNRPNGGIPVGRITEITGLEASGKSLLAAHLIASTQKQGGLGVYIDTEAATSREYFQAIGIDTAKMLYIPLETMEDIFATIETIIQKVRASNKDRLVTIIVDSVMGASTYIEMESDYAKDGYATAKAIIISKGMRKITNLIARQKICLVFTNQLRDKVGVMGFGDKYTTSGGKALAFHSSVRLRLQSVGQIKVKKGDIEEVVGVKTQCKVQKNRVGPPSRVMAYEIYFDSGIDNYGGWFNILKARGILTGANPYTYTFNAPMEVVDPKTGKLSTEKNIKFKSKEFAAILEANPNLKAEIYQQMCDQLVMKYRVNEDFGADDVILDENFVGEDD